MCHIIEKTESSTIILQIVRINNGSTIEYFSNIPRHLYSQIAISTFVINTEKINAIAFISHELNTQGNPVKGIVAA